MSDSQLAELFQTQKSLTEWLEDIKHTNVEQLRKEDNDKRERLRTLNEIINLPFDKPVQFEASGLNNKNKKFQAYLQEHGEDLCALRLIPKEEKLPKLRMRGKKVTEAYEWFKQQDIDAKKYKADFVPHPPDNLWATIFIVNEHGIQGEIIKGGHHLLTQGFHDKEKPSIFYYDFSHWRISPEDNEALNYLKELVEYLFVKQAEKQQAIKAGLGGEFTHNFLKGYFESTHSSSGTWFIDYNQTLGEMYKDLQINTSPPKTVDGVKLSGRVGNKGIAEGIVHIIPHNEIEVNFEPGSILVCTMTTPNHVPLMNRAAAIITDQGGILSHAAIVAREMGKPCIVGTETATKALKDGDRVLVDADQGIITLLT